MGNKCSWGKGKKLIKDTAFEQRYCSEVKIQILGDGKEKPGKKQSAMVGK